MKQQTLAAPFSIYGIGLHTGTPVQAHVLPAEVNSGIIFKRTDLDGSPSVAADVRYVGSTTRCTVLEKGPARAMTVEHLLSALFCMGVDNAEVLIDAEELPILDGTALPFVQAIRSVGLKEQEADRTYFEITQTHSYRDEESGAEIIAMPYDGFEVSVMVDFNSNQLGPQFAALNGLGKYESEIAPCRTFVFAHDVLPLLEKDMIKGGDLQNAIVIAEQPVTPSALELFSKKLGNTKVEAGQTGVLNEDKLRFPNEPARHKLLDILGDLALVGKRIKGKIIATKPGHTANTAFAKLLKEEATKQEKLAGVPHYDPTAQPVKDTMQIAAMLPHRYPFLLVDKIIELTESHVVGIKNITFNEELFQGHFPNNPVMPGVLQIEAMAQTGGILALSTVPDPGNWDTYFLKINECKFKQKVVPGDTLIIKLELLAPIRRGIVQMKGSAYVGKSLVSEAELWAQIVRRKVEA